MDRPGNILVRNVSNGPVVTLCCKILRIKGSDLRSHGLYTLGILSGDSGSSLLYRIHTHQCSGQPLCLLASDTDITRLPVTAFQLCTPCVILLLFVCIKGIRGTEYISLSVVFFSKSHGF